MSARGEILAADVDPGDRVAVGYGLGVRTVADVDYIDAGTVRGGFVYDDDMVVVTWAEVSERTGCQLGNTYRADDVVTVVA